METSNGFGTLYRFMEDDERMKYYRQAAAHGNLIAIKELAFFLKHGKGIVQDCREALKWYLIAASFNDVEYRDDRGMEPSGTDVLEWFNKILNDKTLPYCERYAAAFEIAQMFYSGTAVPKSDIEAVKYFKLSAKAGEVTARIAYNTIAKIYCTSEELTPNISMAFHWLKKAADLYQEATLISDDRIRAINNLQCPI